MPDADLRAALGRWFGYSARWLLNIDDVARALQTERPIAISAPRGAEANELAEQIRRIGRRALVVRSSDPEDVRRVRRLVRSDGAPPAVVVEGLHADQMVESATLASDCRTLRVPTLMERREDLARLLGDARRRVDEELGRRRESLRHDFTALYAYSWPGHLDEIARVMRWLVMLRANGSLRRTASALGVSKSTLSDHLRSVGIKV
jgi:hypothetical protein